ncbi:MAG: hypothetical protein ACK4M2_01265 [Brevundimonas sp.]
MSLKKLLEQKGLRRALIVDDACDEVPTAADIGVNDNQWAIFGDDWGPHRDAIAGVYGPFEGRNLNQLKAEDKFVAALWTLRDELRELLDPLFLAYQTTQQADVYYVDLAKSELEALGLEVALAGRDFAEPLRSADIVLIDLFLGTAQDADAVATSKDGLRAALGRRGAPHPLVILMSRSIELTDRRDVFRDDVGLLDSGFRILKKEELETAGRLEIQLQRIAAHVEDTRRLGAFVDALEIGLEGAAKRTLAQFRRLKLSDIGQIQQLLLDVEGEPTGSYLVDVFDRVLAHEIESESGIIDAAQALNEFKVEAYPAPFIAGSAELQNMVGKTLTQSAERLRLPTSESRVSFGDILRLQPPASADAAKRDLLVELDETKALVVLTPACDLAREGAPRVLLLVGELCDFRVADWSYKNDLRTSVIEVDGQQRWIHWDEKHVETVSWAQLEGAFENGILSTVARLREAHTLEIQQKVLAGLGRVGMVARMPATFEVEVTAYHLDLEGRPVELQVNGFADGAVCWAGRDAPGNQALRLALTEPAVDDLQTALREVGDENVAQNARGAYRLAARSSDFAGLLMKGLPLKTAETKWKPISVSTGDTTEYFGLIAWNNADPGAVWGRGMPMGQAGVLIHLRDRENARGLSAAISEGLVEPGTPEGASAPVAEA